jgi:hypothetical protein
MCCLQRKWALHTYEAIRGEETLLPPTEYVYHLLLKHMSSAHAAWQVVTTCMYVCSRCFFIHVHGDS